MAILRLQNLRWVTVILGIANAFVFLLGGLLFFLAYPSCDRHFVIAVAVVSVVAGLRIAAMVQSAIAQEATARTVLLESNADGIAVLDSVLRNERRTRYKKWLWWTRLTAVVTVLQFVGGIYLVFSIATRVSRGGKTSHCAIGSEPNSNDWKLHLLVLFMIITCIIALLQCCTRSDVLRWRSYYATKDDAWKAHYSEVFDHHIREALCCLGRVKYLNVLEEDEVFSVAQLLGDLVAYRASGTGHLELLAGLALLQKQRQSPKTLEDCLEAPEELIQEAEALYKFAEAAYTGPLLDLGRSPFLFPCVWLYRQGVMTPWMRNRRPVILGDNWWRGHASAFLKYANLSPDVIRQGCINQAKCKAAYFVLVLHHLRSVVIAVRGTETPEDVITDGLCKECILSSEDLEGLINSSRIHSDLRQCVVSSFPHYGHSGVVEAARDLFKQIEGNPSDDKSDSCSLLSSLLSSGCECEGYRIRIVGHSLGGAIASLLGMRLYHRYPNLHVYAYGPLPCVDLVVANSCSDFVTSIVFNNEYSARLSLRSVLQLRADAITALSKDSKTDTATTFRLARHCIFVSTYQRNKIGVIHRDSDLSATTITSENLNNDTCESQSQNDSKGCKEQDCEYYLWNDSDRKDSGIESDPDELMNPFATETSTSDDPISQFMETVPSENPSSGDPLELYLPGIVVHIVPQPRSCHESRQNGFGVNKKALCHKAYIADRESFKDIAVEPSMFLDHLPWRCHDAMRKVLEARSSKDLHDESQIVDVY